MSERPPQINRAAREVLPAQHRCKDLILLSWR